MRTGCAEGTPLCEKFLPDSNNFQLVYAIVRYLPYAAGGLTSDNFC